MKQRKRIAALLAAGVMLFSSLPANALGAERQNTGSLCEHHPAHTAECGYAEGTEGAPCNHQHTDECYTFVTECVHEHTEDCYPAEGVSDNTATPSETDEAEPTACTHVCSEESGCISKELDCQHEHDSECGYTPATEGAPCTYVCPICPVQAQINALPTADELGNMTEEEQQAAYEKLQAAYDAYNALTDEQKAEITGAEIFDSLFAVFNGMVNTLEEEPVSYISYYWDKNAQKLVQENKETIETYTLLTADSVVTDWTAGWYVVEGTVNLPSRVNVTGEVHLILKNGCHLNANQGIQVETGNSLTIYAQSEEESRMGRLTATGGNQVAGIGGGEQGASGSITINGGAVTATGGKSGAGIGGGYKGAGQNITIHGGTVTATGGEDGAGIGGGFEGAGEGITINGGTVTATGGSSGAGIGGGFWGAGEKITINGGIVTAAGGSDGAGIGGGYISAGQDITINGGIVTAAGESGGAGIGGGFEGAGKGITINGGTVTATGGDDGAGIGGGYWAAGEGITINGGGYWAAGEGITINGGTVTAVGGGGEAGIGGGFNSGGENIIITNGSVKASSISITPTDGTNDVYLAKLAVQSGVNEVTLDSGTGEKTFKRAGDHPDGDTAFYLYLTGKDHEITVSNTKYKAIWNGNDGFNIKEMAPTPTVTIAETTASSITVEELADKDTYGGAEYSLDGANWQPSNVLTDLHSNTTYTVYARYKGNDTYAMSDKRTLENVLTSEASYTITIPAVTLEAGKADSSASIAVDTEKSFDLGHNGHVDVTVKENSGVDNDGNLTLTRQNDTENHTITSALLVNGTALGDIDKNIATFKARTDTPVTISFAKPAETDILAGTYKGTITFVVSYSEQKGGI